MRIVRLLSGFVAAVSLVAVPVRAQSVPPPPAATPWYWQNPLPHGNPLSAASCPDAATCYAVGSATTEVSHARGQWSVNLDKSLGTLTALSCPDSATCFALSNVGPNVGAILGTTDGGQMWTRLRPTG